MGVGLGSTGGEGDGRERLFSIAPTKPPVVPSTPAENGGSHRSPFFQRRNQASLLAFSALPTQQLTRSFLIHPGSMGFHAQGASPLVSMLTPALMEPQRLQPLHPSPLESQGNHPPILARAHGRVCTGSSRLKVDSFSSPPSRNMLELSLRGTGAPPATSSPLSIQGLPQPVCLPPGSRLFSFPSGVEGRRTEERQRTGSLAPSLSS